MKDNESEMIEKIRKVFEEYGYTFDRYSKQVVGTEYFTPFGRQFDVVDSREEITFHLIKVMSKVHQICPICAACNTKQKDGYYMCCACRHKWRDVESSVFDRITASPEVLAESLVFWEGGWTSRFINFTTTNREDSVDATVAKLKEVYNETTSN